MTAFSGFSAGRTIFRSALAILFTGLFLAACDSPIDVATPQPFVPVSSDSVAVNWTPFLVKELADSAIAAPPSDEEGLDAVRSAMQAVGDAQRAEIERWNTGTILRWNDLMRALVARYNAAPQPERTPAGAFTGRFLPDPNKPFATPPFAARLYALVNTGQYDALLWAWKLKYRYNRSTPAQADASIVPKGPQSGTPSYPNEDAVISRVAVEVLAFFYPGERMSLEAQYQECVRSRIAAGLARPSDVVGGDSLGRIVARTMIDRARTDNFGKADDQARWKGIETVMKTSWPRWKSTETPARPPMLPFFGEVSPWNIPSAEAVDPGPPPTDIEERYKQDLAEMRTISSSRTREQIRIANFWADGEGTFTPPIHWHVYACQQLRESRYSAVRAARVMAYVSTSLHDAAVACWYTKYKYNTARPVTIDNAIRMPIGLPNFPGYTSGHSTFSGAAATVLSHFFPSYSQGYNQMAREAGDSRVYGCIHVRTDCTVGLEQGNRVGTAAVERARLDNAE